ncbi:MAG TPA: hypothetical protein P5186_24205 [Candidatus Paceibacterota bacterium]|nr:hypothetical protein [Verrucomicrobiota bacterium]HRY51165.1 hypothetical protein [Candidatus Paceibacterota bacterium]
MNTAKNNPDLAAEVVLRKQKYVQHRQRLWWLFAIQLSAGMAVGLGVWFWHPPPDRDHIHFGFSLGLAGGAFFACAMLGRVLFPKPNATCPRCACDWEAESDNNGQTWLAWNVCPGCGLKISEHGGKQP